ncbi:Protein kinase-like domain [Pseudocohnilembus persalinus]|uniref:Protein kinase-like domain n=1 Tax=Pseudocohnilembus persalinus TaxID=266149 RepID=A0A0V0QBP7_PSEPJ|nr:Protein kinase-like domain [Pseudocohnilembus persalinus]|eukprot:KRW99661.1 Protein kinase-like domain [Pseudocohnilembus persalinus]
MSYKIIKNLKDKYQITDKVIGQGSFATVYLGINKQNRQLLAIKQQKFKQEEINQIDKEIAILISFQDQQLKNIIQIYDSYSEGEYVYIVQELCNMGSLQSLLEIQEFNKGFPEDLVVYFLQQIQYAMLWLKQEQFVHRDLKLDNILINQQLQIKLADFGLAKHAGQNQNLGDSIVGTPLTMAPEVYYGKQQNQKCDVWSLGIILYQMTYGCYPLQARTQKKLSDELERIRIQGLTFPNKQDQLLKVQGIIQTIKEILAQYIYKYEFHIKENYLKLHKDAAEQIDDLIQNISTKFKDNLQAQKRNYYLQNEQHLQQKEHEYLKLDKYISLKSLQHKLFEQIIQLIISESQSEQICYSKSLFIFLIDQLVLKNQFKIVSQIEVEGNMLIRTEYINIFNSYYQLDDENNLLQKPKPDPFQQILQKQKNNILSNPFIEVENEQQNCYLQNDQQIQEKKQDEREIEEEKESYNEKQCAEQNRHKSKSCYNPLDYINIEENEQEQEYVLEEPEDEDELIIIEKLDNPEIINDLQSTVYNEKDLKFKVKQYESLFHNNDNNDDINLCLQIIQRR